MLSSYKEVTQHAHHAVISMASHYSLQKETTARTNVLSKVNLTQTDLKTFFFFTNLQCSSVVCIKSINICSILQQNQHFRQVSTGRGIAEHVSYWPFSHSCKKYKEILSCMSLSMSFWQAVRKTIMVKEAVLTEYISSLLPTHRHITSGLGLTNQLKARAVKNENIHTFISVE